jgi:hypothetical protein
MRVARLGNASATLVVQRSRSFCTATAANVAVHDLVQEVM